SISYCHNPTCEDAAANEIRSSLSRVVFSAQGVSSMAAPSSRIGGDKAIRNSDMAKKFVSGEPISNRLGPLRVRQIKTRLRTRIAPLAPLAPHRIAAHTTTGNGRYRSNGR